MVVDIECRTEHIRDLSDHRGGRKVDLWLTDGTGRPFGGNGTEGRRVVMYRRLDNTRPL